MMHLADLSTPFQVGDPAWWPWLSLKTAPIKREHE